MSDSSRISPTAHYTSTVWFRHGLSHPALATARGARLHAALRPMNACYERLGTSPSLDMMLLARHLSLDALLEREIGAGRVGQVIEVAAGLSPRGARFTRRFADLPYLETDLPAMVRHKRRALEAGGLRGPRHEVVALDALAEQGPASLEALARRLDRDRGLAILTEGLLGYFDTPAVEAMWRRFARVLRGFAHGVYLSDLNLAGDVHGMRSTRAFRLILSRFARGRVHLHWDTAAAAEAALRDAGFATAALHLPCEVRELAFPGGERHHTVRLVEARVEEGALPPQAAGAERAVPGTLGP